MTKRKEGKRWAFMIILWSGRTGQCSRCPLMRESGESGGDGNNAPQNILWFTGYTDIQPGSALAIASTISFAFSSPQRSRMSEARSRPIWMGPLNSVMLLYPFRQISAAVPHNRRHRMVGIAGYR